MVWSERCRCWVVLVSYCDIPFCCIPVQISGVSQHLHSIFLLLVGWFLIAPRQPRENLIPLKIKSAKSCSCLFSTKCLIGFPYTSCCACCWQRAEILCSCVTDCCPGTAVFPLLYSMAAGENHWGLPFQSKWPFDQTDFTDSTQLTYKGVTPDFLVTSILAIVCCHL